MTKTCKWYRTFRSTDIQPEGMDRCLYGDHFNETECHKSFWEIEGEKPKVTFIQERDPRNSLDYFYNHHKFCPYCGGEIIIIDRPEDALSCMKAVNPRNEAPDERKEELNFDDVMGRVNTIYSFKDRVNEIVDDFEKKIKGKL